MNRTEQSALLSGVRVIDMAEQKLETVGRLLADMGADVIRVEPVGGAPSRHRAPLVDGTSVYFAVHNANKRSTVLDLESEQGRQGLRRLLADADIWIETSAPGELGDLGLDPDEVLAALPHLVILSGTDFGQFGAYSSFRATEAVELALGTQLSRSGLPGREPLMLPVGMCHEATAVQAAWATLVSYYQRVRTGVGDRIDFSIFDATVQALDPALGTIGTATAGRQTSAQQLSKWVAGYEDRGRPAVFPYPIFPCADGYVRVAVLTGGQWLKMRAWLGEPEGFRDPRYQELIVRYENQDAIYALYTELFRGKSKAEIADEAQRRGVPIVAVLSPQEVLEQAHFEARGAFATGEVAPGVRGRLPSGYFEVDGTRAGFRHRAPEAGEHDAQITAELVERAASSAPPDRRAVPELPRRPLSGVRVVDLGTIVYGAEVSRLLGDLGAEIIKVESAQFVDAARRSADAGLRVTAKYAVGQRNKKSFGVEMTTPAGVDLVKRLVAESDVVLSNFKPGVLEKLGLGYADLRAVNPSIVWLSASGFGHTGPWRGWMGYGPLVRSASGLTDLWRYPDDAASFADQVTIYPDHFSGRVGALAVLGGLLRKQRTGAGADIRLSQAETVINNLGEYYLHESLSPGSAAPTGNASPIGAPWNVYPCAGEDEWCVITVRDDDEWRRFGDALGNPDWTGRPEYNSGVQRLAHREALDRQVAEWTRTLPPEQVMTLLQAAGVPAGYMRRVGQLADDRHIQDREFIAHLVQPGFPDPLPMENRPYRSAHTPAPALGPAPELGEHSAWVCEHILGLSRSEIADLIERGALVAAAELDAAVTG